MDVKELKFLLKLLGKQLYRASISQIKPNDKTSAAERDRICRQLRDRKLVDCTEEIVKIKLTPSGQALLKLDNNSVPIDDIERKILQACHKGAIARSEIKFKSATARDELIEKLTEKGFLVAAETRLKEVWLTDAGKEFLAKEYQPGSGGNLTLSKQMLGDYLTFLRKYFSSAVSHGVAPNFTEKPSDEEILQLIINLDKELGTENYLPIFYLREKLQPPLSREELDKALYRLQRQDKLEMSSIVETVLYTSEQLRAGIPQDIGGSLFFLIVNH
jgi:predicted transcriptional regulator